MTTAADRLMNAVIKKVKDSGLLWSGVLMGTVSSVATDGTATITRDSNTYPDVRLLDGYAPSVGDTVEFMRTLGGWICLGPLRTSSRPLIQRGTAVTPGSGTSVSWTQVAVTFPQPFPSTPTVVATPVSAASAGSTELNWAVNDVTTTGFLMRSRRTTDNPTTFGWVATCI